MPFTVSPVDKIVALTAWTHQRLMKMADGYLAVGAPRSDKRAYARLLRRLRSYNRTLEELRAALHREDPEDSLGPWNKRPQLPKLRKTPI